MSYHHIMLKGKKQPACPSCGGHDFRKKRLWALYYSGMALVRFILSFASVCSILLFGVATHVEGLTGPQVLSCLTSGAYPGHTLLVLTISLLCGYYFCVIEIRLLYWTEDLLIEAVVCKSCRSKILVQRPCRQSAGNIGKQPKRLRQ